MNQPNLPPLIPRELLFGNPEKTMPQVSPDGSRLAYLAPDEGVLNLWVRTLEQDDDRAVTRDRGRGVRIYQWAFNGRHLCYAQDTDGDENWHLFSTDLQTGVVRDLTPFQGVQADLIAADPAHPDTLLVSLNVRDPRLHDVFAVDLGTGAVTPVAENPGDVTRWVADPDFRVRAAMAATPDGGFEIRARDTADSDWRTLAAFGPDETEGAIYGFTPDGAGLYIGSSLGADTQELRQVDIATGEERVLASSAEVDLDEALMHPTQHHVQAAAFTVDRKEWTILDPAMEADLRALMAAEPGDLEIMARTTADDLWTVLYVRDTAPTLCCLYRRAQRKVERLFTTMPALEAYTLAEMRPEVVTSRDGLTLHCYLTLPPGVEPANLPLVLNVHGGPWARDTWGYDPEAQWLANRGYACLQVNFRGSTGFGKRFLHAGDREWGARMHDDLLDAVAWAVGTGIADRDRVAIYGGSYGGYAALVGAAFTPGVFRCAVDIVGPSNLHTLFASIPPYWEPVRRLLAARIGDPEQEPDFITERSPLFKADQIRCPLLIAQGANDPRVKQAESEQIVEALRKRGKAVEYLVFEDEGHGFARPENRLKFYAAAERFLSTHLEGGRVQD